MQSIRDILDSTLSTGFNYFYGLGDDQGYLRRMLQSSPSLETIYARLKDDIEFINESDEDYFKNSSQLKTFKKLKKYLQEAKKYIKSELNKKKKGGSNWEKKQTDKELRELEKDLRNDLISIEDYNYAVKMLLRAPADNLEEVKSKFEAIDNDVKRMIKKYGYEEESLDFTEKDEEAYYKEFEVPRESHTPDINKLIDEENRRYTMGEFTDIFEDMNAQQTAINNKQSNDPITKKNNITAQKLRNDRIRNLISKKKIPTNMNRAQLDKLTDEQLAGLENT